MSIGLMKHCFAPVAGIVGPEGPAALGVGLGGDQHELVDVVPADVERPVLGAGEVSGLVDRLAAARVVLPDALRTVLAGVEDAVHNHGVLGLARGLQVDHLAGGERVAGDHSVPADVGETRARCNAHDRLGSGGCAGFSKVGDRHGSCAGVDLGHEAVARGGQELAVPGVHAPDFAEGRAVERQLRDRVRCHGVHADARLVGEVDLARRCPRSSWQSCRWTSPRNRTRDCPGPGGPPWTAGSTRRN